MRLNAYDKDVLAGSAGEGAALAMRILVDAARVLGG